MIDVWALKVGEHETVIFGIQRDIRFHFISSSFQVCWRPLPL
jgi:hypothetical protein